MTAVDDRPGLDERYGAAIGSAHLEVLPTRCSVDYLVASGWTRDDLGAKLFRLRTEFDAVRGEHRQAQANATVDFAAAGNLQGKADAATQAATTDEDCKAAKERRREADEAYREATATALTARALILVHLKSLRDTSEAVHSFAIVLATKRRFMRPDSDVHRIAGRALDLWLDPSCPTCQGKGFTGGFRAPVVLCTDCDGTGNRGRGLRAYRLAQGQVGHDFGRALLSEMDGKADRVENLMKAYLRYEATDEPGWGPAKATRLRQELIRLRSAQAQED